MRHDKTPSHEHDAAWVALKGLFASADGSVIITPEIADDLLRRSEEAIGQRGVSAFFPISPAVMRELVMAWKAVHERGQRNA